MAFSRIPCRLSPTHFFGQIPDDLLDPEWRIFKTLELGEAVIPNKYKELMGIAIHTETKCRCRYGPGAGRWHHRAPARGGMT